MAVGDRLPVALTELPQEVPLRQRLRQLGGTDQLLAFVEPFVLVLIFFLANLSEPFNFLQQFVGRRFLCQSNRRDVLIIVGPHDQFRVRHRERQQRIPDLLGGHPAEQRALEEIRLLWVEFAVSRRALVRLRVVDDPLKLFDVVLQPDQFLGEKLHQFRVRCLRLVLHVVGRFDQADPHRLLPKPIGHRQREAWVVARRDPVSEDFATLVVADLRRGRSPQHGRRCDLFRLGIVVLIVVRELQLLLVVLRNAVAIQPHQLLRLPSFVGLLAVLAGGLVDVFVVDVDLRRRPVLDPRRERGKRIELLLSPLVERMIVALSTADARAEKNSDGVVEVVQRHPRIAKHEARRRFVPDATFGGEHVMHHRVPRLVVLQTFFDPIGVRPQVVVVPRFVDQPQDVGHPVIHLAGIAGSAQQAVDQHDPIALGLVAQKRFRLFESGDRAGDVEVRSPNEVLRRRHLVGLLPRPPQACLDERVDLCRRPDRRIAQVSSDRSDLDLGLLGSGWQVGLRRRLGTFRSALHARFGLAPRLSERGLVEIELEQADRQ